MLFIQKTTLQKNKKPRVENQKKTKNNKQKENQKQQNKKPKSLEAKWFLYVKNRL